MPINPKSPQYWRNTKHRPIQKTTEWRKKNSSKNNLLRCEVAEEGNASSEVQKPW